MLFKLSNLNSNLALTLGYLNPALNNSAQLSKLGAMPFLDLFFQDNWRSKDIKCINVDSMVRTSGVKFALVNSLPRKLKLIGDNLIL